MFTLVHRAAPEVAVAEKDGWQIICWLKNEISKRPEMDNNKGINLVFWAFSTYLSFATWRILHRYISYVNILINYFHLKFEYT